MMTNKEKLFEKCRKSLLKKVNEFAKNAAPHYVKNGWTWAVDPKTKEKLSDYIPNMRDIKATTKHMIKELSVNCPNNATGRIQVEIVLTHSSKLLKDKSLAFGYIQLIHEEIDVWVE